MQQCAVDHSPEAVAVREDVHNVSLEEGSACGCTGREGGREADSMQA